jgi:hypothetical protein
MVSDGGSRNDAQVDERTRLLESSQSIETDNSTWKDLKPYIRPLVAANFIALTAGVNDGNLGIVSYNSLK